MASATGPTDTDASSPVIAEQVVLVTGGGRGLGRSIAEAFLREGARVVVNYHQSREAAEHLAGAHAGRAIAVKADVRDRAQVDCAHRAGASGLRRPRFLRGQQRAGWFLVQR